MNNFFLTFAAWFTLMTYKETYSPQPDFRFSRANWRWVKCDFFNGLNGDFFGGKKL